MTEQETMRRIIIRASICLMLFLPVSASGSNSVVQVSGRVEYAIPRTCLAPVSSLRKVENALIRTDPGEVYNVVMDGKGAELAVIMSTEHISVLGTVEYRGDNAWLTVHDYADPRMRSAHEYWRRICSYAHAVDSANRNAAVPGRLYGAEAVIGRYFSARGEIRAWTTDSASLWLATDTTLVRVSLDMKEPNRVFDQGDGLPDALVYDMLSDGKTLWIIHRNGLAALSTGTGSIRDLEDVRFACGKLVGDGAGVWVVSDTGTYRLTSPGAPVDTFRALPTAERIRKYVEAGIWIPGWKMKTRPFIQDPVISHGRICVGSFGAVYEFDGTKWSRISRDGWDLQAGPEGHVWFVGTMGITMFEPGAGASESYAPPAQGEGRNSHFLVTDKGAWLAREQQPGDRESGNVEPGLARLDLATGKWEVRHQVSGVDLDHIDCIHRPEGSALVWVVARIGVNHVLPADPGMMHIKRELFETRQLYLLALDEQMRLQHKIRIPSQNEKRLVCGRGGSRVEAGLQARSIPRISVGPDSIFAAVQLFPEGFFTGYRPAIAQVAVRNGEEWDGTLDDNSVDLNLLGEFPEILNISHSGRRIAPALGHDEVLGLFHHRGKHWCVTEGCVAVFDARSRKWTKLFEREDHFYWRAVAARDEGEALYVKSDRGMLARLDLPSGRWTALGKAGAAGLLGRFPANLERRLPKLQSLPACLSLPENEWLFKLPRRVRYTEKSDGNFLWGPTAKDDRTPRYYVKEVYFPRFLCESTDGKRLWISTFTGIVRLDVREN